MNIWLLHSVSVFGTCKCHLLVSSRVGGSASPRSSSSTSLWTQEGTAFTDSPSHSGCWTYYMHSPQVFILAESRTSDRKTGNVSEDSHTNFLQEWEKTTSKIPNPQISQHIYSVTQKLTVRRGQRDLDITPTRISVALNACRRPATSCKTVHIKQQA